MGLPGHRRTSSHKRRRAAHFALKKTNLLACKNCGEAIRPHQTCLSCGMYAGRKVLNLARTSTRLVKKKLAASDTTKQAKDAEKTT